MLTFGIDNAADVRALAVTLDPAGRASFTLTASGTKTRVALSLHGVHHVSNALAAAAVAIGLGADVDKTAAALSRAVLMASGRMEVTDRPDGVRIINDAFNANPDSMKAAFTTLEAMADGRRTIAVLGEMKELGADAVEDHRQVGRLVAATGIHVLIAVGADDAGAMAEAAQQDNPQLKVVEARDRDHALALARDLIQPGDIVLVKGSHSIALEHTAQRLARPGTVAGGVRRRWGTGITPAPVGCSGPQHQGMCWGPLPWGATPLATTISQRPLPVGSRLPGCMPGRRPVTRGRPRRTGIHTRAVDQSSPRVSAPVAAGRDGRAEHRGGDRELGRHSVYRSEAGLRLPEEWWPLLCRVLDIGEDAMEAAMARAVALRGKNPAPASLARPAASGAGADTLAAMLDGDQAVRRTTRPPSPTPGS